MYTRDSVTGLLLKDGVPVTSRLFIIPPQSPSNMKRGRKPKNKPAVVVDDDPDLE